MSVASESVQYTAWLDAHAIADDLMGEAYESLQGHERAVLKKCIARLHVIWGEAALQCAITRHFRQGFGVEAHSAPAPYALILCEAEYSYPAPLLAAFMPAVLAGVSLVVPCFVTSETQQGTGAAADIYSPSQAPLLAALELAGAEHVCSATTEEIYGFFTALHTTLGIGRIVVLGSANFTRSFVLEAHEKNIPCKTFSSPPLYKKESSHQLCIHGQDASADSCESATALKTPAVLTLDEAHEDIWLWPDCDPSWFCSRSVRIFKTSV